MNFYSDVSEWQYLFKNAIDWETILPLYHKEFPTTDGFQNQDELLNFYEELLTLIGKWSGETLAPRAIELDRIGSGTLVDGHIQHSDPLLTTYREAAEMDLFGMMVDPQLGGMGVPVVVGLTSFAQLSRACFATCTQLAFFTSIADMIERFCEPEIRDKYLPKILKGEISGSMCLTEPDSGSDVGSLRTTAERQADGTYRLNGTKIFITNGGGGLGFVLARVKGSPKGLEHLSLFFVEEWLDTPEGRKANYRIGKIEEKMGMHGSPTCEVIYEDTVARLVGKENQGFELMLYLMNEARISVGLQTLGGMEACLHAAKEYALSRKQFGQPVAELPLMKRLFQDWETERDAFRALMVDTISHFDVFQRLHLKQYHAQKLNEKETQLYKKASKIVRKRTPLVKYYGSEANATLSQRAIQVFGGYGFILETGIERYHRECFGALLYEGTSQIQSLMAMKDFIKKTMKDPKKFLQGIISTHPLGSLMSDSDFKKSYTGALYEFRKNVAILLMRCFIPGFSEPEKNLLEGLSKIGSIFKSEHWKDAARFEKVMAHAETLCQALSYLETLQVLSQHAIKDSSRGTLYRNYFKLVSPRLAGIYADWKSI